MTEFSPTVFVNSSRATGLNNLHVIQDEVSHSGVISHLGTCSVAIVPTAGMTNKSIYCIYFCHGKTLYIIYYEILDVM